MRRRDFLQRATCGAGAFAVAGQELSLHPGLDSLTSMIGREPAPIPEEERAARRAKAQQLMGGLRASALLVEPGPSLLYFAGVTWGRSERLFAMLLPQRGDAVFICPAFEQQRAESRIGGRFAIRVWQEDQSPYALVAATLREWGYTTRMLAVESSARFFVADALARLTPALTVVAADPILEECRGFKTAHEVALMRHANLVTIEAYRATLKTLRTGMTQGELSRNLGAAFQKLGYSGGALVLFGESSAYPHGLERPRALEEGQVVLIDGGTSVHGYQSDITRTVVFGEPAPQVQHVHEIVREAQARAFKAARPGVTAGHLDAIARDYITSRGYGPDYRYFTHRLGHGIGLEGHEWPYLVRGSQVVLRPGMSFSNEPGIYQYGSFGVRLEDIMVMTDDGAEMLTPPSRSLSPSDV